MASVAGGTAAGTAPPPYHSTGTVKTNYVVEHAAPSAVCLVRKIQTSPYQPLPSEQVQSVTLPNLLSLRSPPHVAHQALMDFYFAMNGHCGINCSDPSSLDLITVAVHARNAGGSGSNTEIHSKETPRPHAGTASPYYHATGSVSTTPLNSAMPNNDSKNSNMLFLSNETPPVIDGGMYTHSQQQQQSNSAPSVLGAPIIPPSFTSSSSEDYRLSQIRRNERHVNNALYGKVCAFFNTREGCRRGPYCHFLHIGKGGGGSAGNGGGAAPQQFY